jgi:exopolysaccharide production protein ExoY
MFGFCEAPNLDDCSPTRRAKIVIPRQYHLFACRRNRADIGGFFRPVMAKNGFVNYASELGHMSDILLSRPIAVRASREISHVSVDDALTGSVNFTIALLALLFLAPLMIAVAIAVYMQDGGKPVFAHRRIGRGGKHFYCLKFRSMAVDAEQRLQDLLARDPVARTEWEKDHKLREDPRVTKLGAFLRKSSLDELPQLLNVLRGEMSLVGPRPIVDAEVVKYGRRFDKYCAVKPGITGLWQVSGRNDTSYRTRVALDCVYAQRRNVGLDMTVMARTVPAVLLRKGSY